MIEVVLGLGLVFEPTRTVAAYGIILLLIAVFPANLYMYQRKEQRTTEMVVAFKTPITVITDRWAYIYT